MSNTRIAYLDSLKGLAILLVVMGHTLAWNYSDWTIVLFERDQASNVRMAGFLFQFIYSFHMPLFFFISGFFVYKEKCNWLQNLRKKTKAYFIPYIVTGFFPMLWPGGGNFGYWFLLALYQLTVLAIIIMKLEESINRPKSFYYDLMILGLVFLCLFFFRSHYYSQYHSIEIWKFAHYFVPFFCGFLFRKYYSILEDFISYKRYTCFLLLFLLSFFYRYFEDVDMSCYFAGIILSIINHSRYYLSFLVYEFTLPLSGCLFFYVLFKYHQNNTIEHVFSLVGKYTLGIYIFHMFFIIQIPSIGSFWLESNLPTVLSTQICYSLICSVIAISISIILTKIIGNSTILNKLVLGK